ncbi:MAG: beta-lactamase family protein [Actinomycetota bacterium]|nr:beta-lactamase family protein [Actinomycetota bacterium]MDQ2956624.1 beta-lactamase family protein [Actinomycetota bacterium]
MTAIEVTADPAEVGVDADRLKRIDSRLARYVAEGRLPGWQAVVTRRGQVVHASSHGLRDVASNLPVEPDTLFRIYSMTKPVTSVAAMMLWEQGEFQLTDPIRKWLPEFAEPQVYVAGSDLAPATVPATEPIRVRHLLTHTAGLTYGFMRSHPVDARYRSAGLDEFSNWTDSLAQMSQRWAAQPLVFQPGAEWQYSVATDVLGRLVEVISGMSLEAFFDKHILGPLKMTDTSFVVAEANRSRLAELYNATPDGFLAAGKQSTAVLTARWPSGGHGLVSSAHDYHRFSQLLLRGGELDGVRLLAPSTVALMTTNHLPGGVDLAGYGRPLFAESPMRGVGFGYGMSTTIDVPASGMAGSVGDYGWGGLASTVFTVDPARELTMLFFTQLIPSSALPLRALFRQLVHQAIVA